MPIEFVLRDAHGLREIFVGELWIQDLVPVVFQECRLDAARNRPAETEASAGRMKILPKPIYLIRCQP